MNSKILVQELLDESVKTQRLINLTLAELFTIMGKQYSGVEDIKKDLAFLVETMVKTTFKNCDYKKGEEPNNPRELPSGLVSSARALNKGME